MLEHDISQSNAAARHLAEQFIDVTVDKWGTDERAVDALLRQVHDGGIAGDFERALWDLLDSKTKSNQYEIFTRHDASNLVPAILRDEMSGSQLARALDLYTKGEDSYRAASGDYFLEGLSSVFDFSSTESKVILGLGTAAFAGLTIISAPAAAIAGTVLLAGTAVYGVGTVVKNGVELVLADSDQSFKDDMRDLGAGLGITVTATVPLPLALKVLKPARTGTEFPLSLNPVMAADSSTGGAYFLMAGRKTRSSIPPRIGE